MDESKVKEITIVEAGELGFTQLYAQNAKITLIESNDM